MDSLVEKKKIAQRRAAERSGDGSGRKRLIKAAQTMFTTRGFANVGINEVTDGAGVARMTLYNNFPSKDALVWAVYEDLITATLAGLPQNKSQNEVERVIALFSHFESKAKSNGGRGCPLIHASLQTAEPQGQIFQLVSEYKQSLRKAILERLEPKRSNRGALADQLLLLLDGAAIEMYLRGVSHPGRAAKEAARTLLRS